MIRKLYIFICLALIFLCACDSSVSNTSMQFSFNTSGPADSRDEKIIYVNHDMDMLELDAKLKTDSGEVTVQVVDVVNNQVVWSEKYSQDAGFTIILEDLKADSEYLLEIQATGAKDVQLAVTSDTKLVKDREKPEKQAPEKYSIG